MVRLLPEMPVSVNPKVELFNSKAKTFWSTIMMAVLVLLSLARDVSFDGASSMLGASPLLSISPSSLILFRNNIFPNGHLPLGSPGGVHIHASVQSSYLKSLFKDNVAQSFAEVSEKQSEQSVTFVCYTLVKPIIINIPPSPHY